MSYYTTLKSSKIIQTNVKDLPIVEIEQIVENWYEDNTVWGFNPDEYRGDSIQQIFTPLENLHQYKWVTLNAETINELLTYPLCCLLTSDDEDYQKQSQAKMTNLTCDVNQPVELFDCCWLCCSLNDNPKLDNLPKPDELITPTAKRYSNLESFTLKQLKEIFDNRDNYLCSPDDYRRKQSYVDAYKKSWRIYHDNWCMYHGLKNTVTTTPDFWNDKEPSDRDWHSAFNKDKANQFDDLKDSDMINPQNYLEHYLWLGDYEFNFDYITIQYRLKNFDKNIRFSYLPSMR